MLLALEFHHTFEAVVGHDRIFISAFLWSPQADAAIAPPLPRDATGYYENRSLVAELDSQLSVHLCCQSGAP